MDPTEVESDGSSSSGSSSAASSFAWSSAVTSNNAFLGLVEVLQKGTYTLNNVSRVRWFDTIVLALSIICLICLPLDAVIRSSAPGITTTTTTSLIYGPGTAEDRMTNRSASVSEIPRYLFDPAAATDITQSVFVWLTIVLETISCLAFSFVVWMGWRDLVPPHKLLLVLTHWLYFVVRVAAFPMAYACVRAITSETIMGIVTGSIGLIVSVPGLLYSSWFQVNFIPSSSHTAQITGRGELALFLLKLAFAGMYPLEAKSEVARTSVMAACFLVILIAHVVMMPFWRHLWNYIFGAVFATCLWLSVCAVTAAACELSGTRTIVPFIVGLCGAVPCGAVVWFLMMLRRRQIKKNFEHHTFVLSSERQVKNMIHSCLGSRVIHDDCADRAIFLLSEAKEKYPESFLIYFLQGLVRLELHHDPRGMATHMIAAKRFTNLPDLQFAANSLLVHAQEVIKTNVRSVGSVEMMLETAARNTKVAKMISAKFWNQLIRSRTTGVTNDRLMFDLMVSFDHHETKAHDLLLYLVNKYPNDFKVMRQYARFLDEVHNDKDSAQQMFLMADQCEEDAAKRSKKKDKKKGGRHVQIAGGDNTADTKEDNEEKGDVEMGGLATGDEDNSTDEIATSRSASSIGSSASAITTNNNAHSKMLRSRIEQVKSPTTSQMQAAGVAGNLMLFFFIALLYSLGTVTIASFNDGLSVVNKTAGCRQDLTASVFFTRIKEMVMLEDLHQTNRTVPGMPPGRDVNQDILIRAQSFEDSFNFLFLNSKMSTKISDYWAVSSQVCNYYVPGANLSDVSYGKFTTKKLPLWDAGQTAINFLRETAAIPMTLLYDEGLPNMRTQIAFRYSQDNPQVIGALDAIATMHAELLKETTDTLFMRVMVVFSVMLASTFVLVLFVRLVVLRRLKKERAVGIKLFSNIPKSTLINVAEHLCSEKERDLMEEVVTRNNIGTTWKVEIILALVTIFCLAMAGTMFGLFVSFSQQNANVGKLVSAVGRLRNSGESIRLWAAQLVSGDTSSRTLTATQTFLVSALKSYADIDKLVKYGNSSQGVTSAVAVQTSINELVFTRPCPPEFKLGPCKGLAQYYANYAMLATNLANAPPSVLNMDNKDYAKLVEIQEVLNKQWMLDLVLATFVSVVSNNNAAGTNVTIVFVVSIPVLIIGYIVLVFYIRRLTIEIERLVKMLLCVPLNVLETTSNVKQFLESGKLTTADDRNACAEEEQQIQHIVDGSSDAVVVCDGTGKMQLINPALVKLTGFDRDELLGGNVNKLLQPTFTGNADFLTTIFEDTTTKSASSSPPANGAPATNTITTQQQAKMLRETKQLKVTMKAGTTVDVMVSVSKSMANGKVSYGLFMRDITDLIQREAALDNEKQRAEAILMNILPRAIIAEMATLEKGEKKRTIAHGYDDVSIMFVNICGFSDLTKEMDGEGVVMMLNTLVCQWDKTAIQFGNAIEKIKTIGDIYMCCSGAPVPCADHAEAVVEFAIAILTGLKEFNKTSKTPVSVKIGINSGPVVGGVLGLHKFVFDIYGDCVNVASRMQSNGVPNRIQISQSTHNKLKDKGYKFESRGKVLIKGKGEMECFLVDPACYDEETAEPGTLQRKFSAKYAPSSQMAPSQEPSLLPGQPQQI